MEKDIWQDLYLAAKSALMPRKISPYIEAGGVASALITKNGNIYVGVCIDTACTLGMCAERNAISTMITHGEHHIDKILTISKNGNILLPCGACREYMMQLSEDSGDIEILTDLDAMQTLSLQDLIPAWWGKKSYQ